MKPQICDHCSKEYIPSRGPSKMRAQKFCSNICRGLAYRGAANSQYKGGFITRSGYKMISVAGKRILEHRHVMQEFLNRPLKRNEVIHHINHNKLDNRIENLEITTQPEHVKKHFIGPRDSNSRICRVCKQIKPRTDFDKQRTRPDQEPSHSQCKDCRSRYYAKRWKLGLTSRQRH